MIDWQWQAFEDIPRSDLYQVLQHRQQVFMLNSSASTPTWTATTSTRTT